MSLIKAVVVDPEAAVRLVLGQVEAPVPTPSQAIVRVAAVSLNRGEVRGAGSAPAGYRPGWDLAGTVEQAAPDGSGPAVGARVVGLLASGAWTELAAVPTHALAELPAEVSFAQAATLPVAGLTALYMLDKRGGLLERKVLVTGATGGVGLFAVQLARHVGARVVAVIRRPGRESLVRDAGAHEVVVSEDASLASEHGPYDLILDAVGGPVLASALTMLAHDGVCVTYGVTAAPDATIEIGRFFRTGGASLYGFYLFHEVNHEPAAVGLGRLARMLAQGWLRAHIEVEASWVEVGKVAQRLLDRDFAGKAVLHIA